MKRTILAAAFAVALSLPTYSQQQPPSGNRNSQADRQAQMDQWMARMKEEARTYYANADTAAYGVRYRMKYLYNKERNLTFYEDRVVLISTHVNVDQSYEPIGESRWFKANPGTQAGDPGLAYNLTPSFHFYYPEYRRCVDTYRVITEEFLLADETCDNKWNVTDERMKIGVYECRKATLERGGRSWTAWFTTDLPNQAAPYKFNGLPGVVLQVTDADNEIGWYFNGLVENLPDDTLFVKYPDSFTKIPVSHFPKLLKLVAVADATGHSYAQRSGVMNKRSGIYPEKYHPSKGIDACDIDNPIER